MVAALVLGSTVAQAACNFSSGSGTAATITMTGTGAGNAVGLCVSNDTVRWGLFGSSNGSNPNIDTFQNYPMTAGGLSLTNLSYTSAKATYTLVPVNNGSNNFHTDEYDIQINSLSGGGTDTITLWYTSSCSQTVPCTSGVHSTDTSFTITVNLPSPSVTSISPTSGPTAGGTSVVITGANFTGTTGAAGVKFGANNATSYVVNSNTQITAVAPAGSVGTVDVTVTTNGVTSATSAADHYTYVAAPTVTSVAPTAGPTGGSTTVTIGGTGFVVGATTVNFGGAAGTGVTVNSATSITVTSPPGAAGTVDVTVTTAGGTSATSASDKFTYLATPTVTSVAPTTGPTAGSTTVTIGGTGFVIGATTVNFGGAAGTGVNVTSATSLTVTSPPGAAGTVDVTVTTAGGTSATSASDKFTYLAAPTVTSVAPTTGPTAGS
ncbi:IPT/TIG domain-containing protein, partial [Bradyrhizobium sp. SSUT18]|uniref:beta strand repeat-containing protein n=1 Tax=Bradyrhizobium sp. SSUT18 TaxID=3040602 RepID=UPI00244D3CAE